MLTHSTVRWLVVIFWGIGAGLLNGSGAYGQTSTPVPPGGGMSAQAPNASVFTGVDVAFVVDQSGSMTGAMRLNTEGSDPDGLRFQSMQFAMEWLADFRYFAASPDSTVRMSVIGFGDPEQTVVMDWVELSPPSYSDVQRQNQRDDLRRVLSEDYFGEDRHFGYTNFEGALREARQQFDSLAALPDGQRNLRVIIIVTDGEPCALADVDEDNNCTNLAANQAQLGRVEQLVNRAFPPATHKLYILAMENPNEPYWSTYEGQWLQVVRDPNQARVIPTASNNPDVMPREVTTIMTDIVGQLTSSLRSTPIQLDANGRGSRFIPPYVGSVSFNVFKSASSTSGGQGGATSNTLTLTTPDGAVLDSQSPGITVSGNLGNIERWQVPLPAPGDWEVQVNNVAGTSVSMVLDEYLLQMRLLGAASGNQPQQEEHYQWQRVPIEPYMYFPQPGNNPEQEMEIDSNYPLAVEAYITSPQGGQQTLTLSENTASQQGNNVYPQFVGDFVPLERGEYVVDVAATVPSVPDPGNTNQAFSPLDTRSRASKARIAVSPVVVTATTSQQGDWIETVAEDVCVIIQDSVNRRRVDDMDGLNVEAVLSQGGSEVDRIPLAYQADLSEQCTFTGDVLPPGTGTYTLTVEAFAPDGNGVLQEVFSTLPAAPLNKAVTVQPIDRIRLEVVEPPLEPGESTATSYVIDDRPFWQRQPLIFSVIAKDQNDQPVDLASLAGVSPDEAVDLQVTSTNGNATPTLNFVRASNHLYQLETFELGRDAYILSAIGAPLDPEACQCNYVVDGSGNLASTVSVGINRAFPLIVLAQFGAGLLGLVVVAGVAYGVYNFYVKRTKNPPTGHLVITMDHAGVSGTALMGEEVTTLPLGGRFNRQTFSGSDLNLPGDLPIKSIFVTNDGKEAWKNDGKVKVRIKYKQGNPLTQILTPGQIPVEIHRTDDGDDTVTYFISKDPNFDEIMFGP